MSETESNLIPPDEDPSGYPPNCCQDLRHNVQPGEVASPYDLFIFVWTKANPKLNDGQILALSRTLRGEADDHFNQTMRELYTLSQENNPSFGVLFEKFLEDLQGLSESQ